MVVCMRRRNWFAPVRCPYFVPCDDKTHSPPPCPYSHDTKSGFLRRSICRCRPIVPSKGGEKILVRRDRPRTLPHCSCALWGFAAVAAVSLKQLELCGYYSWIWTRTRRVKCIGMWWNNFGVVFGKKWQKKTATNWHNKSIASVTFPEVSSNMEL